MGNSQTIEEKVKKCKEEHPEYSYRTVAKVLGISNNSAYRYVRQIDDQYGIEANADDDGAYCFAYIPQKRACKALKEKDENCNTPYCPFYKTVEEYTAGIEKSIERCKKTGCLYGKDYRPKE